MGRRGISVLDGPRWVFNRFAAIYHRRPAYPAALLDSLVDLAAGGKILDLGAGTGFLALPLARRGMRVSAVEPAEQMLQWLREAAHREQLPIETFHAAAEETNIGSGESHSLAVIADALQWLQAERAAAEVNRLLAPGGACAVIDVQPKATPLAERLLALMRDANPKASFRPAPVRRFLSLATGSIEASVQKFEDELPLSSVEVVGWLCTLSVLGPALGERAFSEWLRRAEELLAASPEGISRSFTLSVARKARA